MSVAWVGAGIAAVGAYSASQAQGKAEDRQIHQQNLNQEEREQLRASEQATYDEWQSTYGPLEENLADYFNSISSESYVIRGLENQQQAFETSMTRINESLAQRGITNTAVGASLEAQAELQNAEERAKIRTVAPALAAQEQMGFLQMGLGKDQGRDYGGTPIAGVEPNVTADSSFIPGSGSSGIPGNDRLSRPASTNPRTETYAPVRDLVTGESEPGYTTSSDRDRGDKDRDRGVKDSDRGGNGGRSNTGRSNT